MLGLESRPLAYSPKGLPVVAGRPATTTPRTLPGCSRRLPRPFSRPCQAVSLPRAATVRAGAAGGGAPGSSGTRRSESDPGHQAAERIPRAAPDLPPAAPADELPPPAGSAAGSPLAVALCQAATEAWMKAVALAMAMWAGAGRAWQRAGQEAAHAVHAAWEACWNGLVRSTVVRAALVAVAGVAQLAGAGAAHAAQAAKSGAPAGGSVFGMKFVAIIAAAAGVTATAVLVKSWVSKPGGLLDSLRAPEEPDHVLKGKNIEVHISAWGATITKIYAPDRHGNMKDVVLGFDDVKPYQDGTGPSFGSIVGRVANRIAKAEFKLNDRTYKLAANSGLHHLHGGRRGFDKRWWTVEERTTEEDPHFGGDVDTLKLSYTSPSGEEGFPGTVKVTVTYALKSKGCAGNCLGYLETTMEATTDAPTPINLAQHTYWNLGGHDSGSVLPTHELEIRAKTYTPVDESSIPTGEMATVAEGPFDFREAKPIGRDIELVKGGYDHNFVVCDQVFGWQLVGVGEEPRVPTSGLAARVVHPPSGRAIELLTSSAGMQLNSGDSLDGTIVGKGGARYGKHHGFCLDLQRTFPDAINQPDFPNSVLQPDAVFKHKTEHRFWMVDRRGHNIPRPGLKYVGDTNEMFEFVKDDLSDDDDK